MPCQRMSVDIHTGCRCGVDEVGHRTEIHDPAIVHTAGHFHGITGNSLCEITIDNSLDRAVVHIIIGPDGQSQLEIGVLRVIDVLLEWFIRFQVSVIRCVVRITHGVVLRTGRQ